ncbi:hypothetical protein [Jiella sonneratiae]|uniref:Lipoprotein n=1 Tax=Jiella sonneratiae TaxID=2816856 RepID=A0ABS3J6F0_9HYPH|nr:hypothetical protein [Jiella sonneratiae]MBO0905255.1 hypothetical protein [Jiella sonneratiae]
MKPLLLVAALAALSGCTSTASSTAVHKPSTAEAECARFGYTPGTPPYNECVTDMRQQAQVLATARS